MFIRGCITKGSCFFCSVELEHNRHWFLSCSIARMVLMYISLVWMSLTRVVYLFLVGCLHIWRTMNCCLISKLILSSWCIVVYGSIGICRILQFDSQVGVRKYVVKLEGLLLWQLTVLENSRNLNHEERELCAYFYIEHFNKVFG